MRSTLIEALPVARVPERVVATAGVVLDQALAGACPTLKLWPLGCLRQIERLLSVPTRDQKPAKIQCNRAQQTGQVGRDLVQTCPLRRVLAALEQVVYAAPKVTHPRGEFAGRLTLVLGDRTKRRLGQVGELSFI